MNFAFNKKVDATHYNCSQLVWAAWKKQGFDLDRNGGPRSLPRRPMEVTEDIFREGPINTTTMMRLNRRSLLLLAGLVPLAGCTRKRGEWPEADWRRPDQACYLVMVQNMGGGHRMDGTGSGRVVLVDAASGEILRDLPYDPVDQGTLFYHDGKAAWMSAEGVHVLGERAVTHPGLPVKGSLFGIAPAGDGFLLAVNGGQEPGADYEFGLVLFDEKEATSWVHHGVLVDIGWAGGAAVAYNNKELMDSLATLIALSPEGTRDIGAEPVPESSLLWSNPLCARGHEIIAVFADSVEGRGAHLRRIDVRTGKTRRVPLSGAGLDASRWFTSDGPSNTVLVGERLLWLMEHEVWGASITTGVMERVIAREESDDTYWHLQPDALVKLGENGSRFTLSARVGTKELAPVEVEIDGPSDQTYAGVALLPQRDKNRNGSGTWLVD